MTELAAGAVSSLLGVIRNEALLLGRVRHDVQFIKEEMESMKSFLAHLAKNAPAAGRQHNEQIRTWMNQVRLLAQDSNNCIDLYLYRGNPEIHLARAGLRRYLSWLPWFLHKMVAQHRAAIQLRALRERARDIGERRLRYGVEVPAKEVAAGQSPAATGTGLTPAAEVSPSMHAGTTSAVSGDEEEDSDVDQRAATDHSVPRETFLEFPTPEENVRVKLTEWIKNVAKQDTAAGKESRPIPRPSVAIVAPDREETRAIAHEASAMWKKHGTRPRGVLVDIPAVHFYFRVLRTQDILFYILRELQKRQDEGSAEKDLPHDVVENAPRRSTLGMPVHFFLFGFHRSASARRKNDISMEKLKLLGNITNNIEGMGVKRKISEITSRVEAMKGSKVEQMDDDQLGLLLESAKDQPLGVLLRALWLLTLKPTEGEGTSATKQGQENKEVTYSQDDIIKETSKKLRELMEGSGWSKVKEHRKEIADEKLTLEEPMGEKLKPKGQMEEEEEAPVKPIRLNEAQYEHIIREVFPVTIRKPLQIREQDSKQAATGTVLLVDDQIKELISKVLQELQENRSVKHGGTAELQERKSMNSHDCIPDALIEETVKKIGQIQQKMIEQLKINGIIDKINDCLKSQPDRILLILKLDNDFVSGWEETKNAFSTLDCIAGVLLLKTTENATHAREYCCPPREPIDYSLLGLYRDIALDLRKRHVNEDSSHILLDILHKCKQDEFCMKIFVHALYANPKRSNEELRKLHKTLQQVPDNSLNIIDKKMFKFSYGDLPKEYKSCLLYLAIFPPQRSIRRSTLIGRWVVEGLITKEDWAGSVLRANQCFDALVDRWFVHPADTVATTEVKSCVVGDRVHGFITKIARKQHIVETRLSHHLARHFSIFNDLQLRGSDRINKFFQKLHESSRLSLIKVLDLEYCKCFGGKNQSYLKDICSKMLLLKYLSLRGTDVTNLPSEINNLRELEVLDIRETNVPAAATINLLLLKLKRLLAGSVVSSSRSDSTEISYVTIPDKIEKMLNMEVLSNVKPRNHHDMKDIGKLWQLRKLGVVVEHNDKIIRNLLRAISDLHECLRSLSITLPMTEEDPSNENFTPEVLSYMVHSPKLLESLSIHGTTQTGPLLRLLTKDGDQLQLSKVTLSGTRLRQADLEVLAKLPQLACVRLRHKAYIDSKLTFNKEQFKMLKCFLIEGSNITDIIFEDGAALKLEKIVLCSTDGLQSLSGVGGLPKLKEVELNKSNKLSLFGKAKNISRVTLCGTILSQDDVEILAKIPKMRSLVLKDISYVQNQLIFYKDDFPWLNLIIVDFPLTTNMSFAHGSTPMLEKIIWSFRKGTVGTLSGIDNLPKLKELEYNGDSIPGEVEEAIRNHRNRPTLTHNKPENQDLGMGRNEENGDAGFPFCWESQD